MQWAVKQPLILGVTLLTPCLGYREVNLRCRKNSYLYGYLKLVNQAITFKGFLKPKVTKERSAVHSKTDRIIKPGDSLKDLNAPKSC